MARLIQLLMPSPGKRGCGAHQGTCPAQHLLLLPLTTGPCNSSCPGPSLPAWSFSACLIISLLLGMCQCPVPMCLPARAALSACLALSKGSGCLGLPAHPRPSVFFCSVTLVCLSPHPPSSACLRLCLHLPPLALFILVNRTGTCIQAPCAQVGWNCTGCEPRQRTGRGGGTGEVKGSERTIGKGLGDNPASCCCVALLSWKRSSDKPAHYDNDLVPASPKLEVKSPPSSSKMRKDKYEPRQLPLGLMGVKGGGVQMHIRAQAKGEAARQFEKADSRQKSSNFTKMQLRLLKIGVTLHLSLRERAAGPA